MPSIRALIDQINFLIPVAKGRVWLNFACKITKETFTRLMVGIKSFGGARIDDKAIPIKCFVSHRPPSRKGRSVGRAKKKRNEYKKGSGCQ